MIQLKTVGKHTIIAAIVAIQILCYPALGFAQSSSDTSSGSAGSSSSTTPPATDPTPSPTTDSTTPSTTPSTPSTDTSTTSPSASTDPPPSPDPTSTPTPTAAASVSPSPPPTGPQGPTGPTSPTGSDGLTYHYNPVTGVWENAYFTWDPVTKQYTPVTPQSAVYNPATGAWQTPQWTVNAATGTFVPNAGSPKLSSLVVGASGTGPNSNNSISQLNNANGTFNSTTKEGVTNGLTQGAVTGDVLVGQNTKAGNAQSGNATDQATILNELQSTFMPNGEFNTFTANLYGNMNGDLFLDPAAAAGPGSTLSINKQTNNNVDVNVANSGSITNNVNLNANSGNVGVNDNSQAGNATSGNAQAVGNIINEMGSSVAAGQSFIGNINIYGNLNGDILIPPDILQQLIASNGPNSNTSVNQTDNTNINANTANTSNIANNTNLTAASGQVSSNANSQTGNATSGSASTGLTVLNLTGSDIIGKDALLVFVNVMGQWVGVIMNAPKGATAGAFGDTTVNSTNNLNANLNATNTGTITNNVNIAAQSGNVDANGNTTVGNLTSGNARAGLNLLNLTNSQLSLTNWLGILFINVFGTWNGSFGVNTPAGNLTNGVANSSASSQTQQPPIVFGLVPTGGHHFQAVALGSSSSSSPTAAAPSVQKAGSKSANNNVLASSSQNALPILQRPHYDWTLPIIGLLTGAALLGLERALAFRQRRFA